MGMKLEEGTQGADGAGICGPTGGPGLHSVKSVSQSGLAQDVF